MSKVTIQSNPAGLGSVNLKGPQVAADLDIMIPGRAGQMMVTGPCFSAYPSVAQVITTSQWTKVNFGTEDWDLESSYDTATSRFQPTVAGIYSITVAVGFTTAVTLVGTYIKKNGVDELAGNIHNSTSHGSNSSLTQGLVFLNGTTDYVEGSVFATGTTPSINPNRIVTRFQGCLVRPA